MSTARTAHTPDPNPLTHATYEQAKRMPTEYRCDVVRGRVRHDFRKAQHETDPARIQFLLQLGETQLDNVLAQAEHLSEIAKMDLSNIKGVKTTVV